MSTQSEAPSVSAPFAERARAVPLAYGTYESRYIAAIAGLVLGPIVVFIGHVVQANGGPPLALGLTVVGFLLSSVAWVLLPGRPERRFVGGLVSTLALVFLPVGLGVEGLPMPALQLFAALASAGAVAGWLIGRERPVAAVRVGLIAVAILQLILAIIVGAVAGGQATDRVDYYFLSQFSSFLEGSEFGVRHFLALFVTIIGGIVLAAGASWFGRRLAIASSGASGSSVVSSSGASGATVIHDLGAVPQRSVLRATLAGIGTLLFLIGGGLAIAGLFVGNGGNPLFYWAYTGFQGRIPQLVAFFVGLVLALAGVALWVVAGLSPNANQRAERAALASESERARSVAAQAEQIKRWEEAYALAHNGERPPPGATPPMIANSGSSRTNTLSILALVFGVLGSVLGIVFGHVALSQIKRTGEGGRGLAIAGLVVGYVQLGVGVLILTIAGILAAVQG